MARRRLLVISTIVIALAGVGAWYGLERAERDGVVKVEAAPVSVTVAIQRSRTLVAKFFETMQVVDQQQAKVDQVIAMIDADQAAIETAQTNLDYSSLLHNYPAMR
jgi:hypothetical protein